MKIVITGNMGYVGPVLARHLRYRWPEAELIGFDQGYFAHMLTGPDRFPESYLSRQVFGDVREFPAELLEGADAVVHLAAISNDPMGERYAKVTDEINYQSTVSIARMARDAGVRSFVFASSCSVYGFAEGKARAEGDSLDPLTAYARSKVASERSLAQMELGSMNATCLRFATACGASPRLRLDLVLNDFVATAMTTGMVKVLSDGTPWRPLIDVADMARAIEWAIGREAAQGGQFLTVNAGSDEWNYQVVELAEAVASAVPGATVSVNKEAPPDRRSYRVDFSLFRELAPEHQPLQTLESAVAGIKAVVEATPGIMGDGVSIRPTIRLHNLERHMTSGKLSPDLNWLA